MSYSVSYSGSLLFTNELTDSEFERLQSLYSGKMGRRANSQSISLAKLSTKYRDTHPSVITETLNNSFTTTINRSETGIEAVDEWIIPVSEINVIILWMREVFPEFSLKGKIDANGEEAGDIFQYYVGVDGFVYVRELDPFRVCQGVVKCDDDISLDPKYTIVCNGEVVTVQGITPKFCPICGGEVEIKS